MKKYISLLLIAASTLFASCDETLMIDNKVSSEPVVEEFSPKAAPVGAIVSVRGQYLNAVTKAYIGEVEVDIVEKVSDELLSVKINNEVRGGKIILESPKGKGVSAEQFTCSYAVPEIFASYVQENADLGETILLAGKNLNSASKVLFTSPGHEKSHEAAVISRSDEELVVKVPYVETNEALITLAYFDGNTEAETSMENAPKLNVVKYVPTFDSYTFERTDLGKSITLTGKNLQNVERISVGGFDANVTSAKAEELSFTIVGEFEDGETVVDLVAHYFDDNESTVLKEGFVVYVPFVKFWENVKTECQTQDPNGMFTSFFSPENGRVYANNLWATELDAIAMELQGSQYSTNNVFKTDKISAEQYDAVLPYFFFSITGGKDLQINSPANSNGQLKNFMRDSYIHSTNRVPGLNTSAACGTPIMAFRCLNKANPDEAALIEKVVSGTLENINEELFPIDTDPAKQTIGGIGFASAAGGLKNTATPKWPGVNVPDSYINEECNMADADCVLMFAYYSFNGYDKDNKVLNVKRIGFVHIKQINWIVSVNDFRGSQVVYNCYWQKYDYDYSKLK